MKLENAAIRYAIIGFLVGSVGLYAFEALIREFVHIEQGIGVLGSPGRTLVYAATETDVAESIPGLITVCLLNGVMYTVSALGLRSDKRLLAGVLLFLLIVALIPKKYTAESHGLRRVERRCLGMSAAPPGAGSPWGPSEARIYNCKGLIY
jgi:hypothetical protein